MTLALVLMIVPMTAQAAQVQGSLSIPEENQNYKLDINNTLVGEWTLWQDPYGVIESESEPKEEPADPCTHQNGEWETWYDPTEYADGMEGLRCTACKAVLDTRGISSMAYWLNMVEKKIRSANPGDTVVAETDIWISFWDKIMIALDENPDVALTCNFKYKGNRYSFTIPARTDGQKTLEEGVGWYGFLYLSGKYDE